MIYLFLYLAHRLLYCFISQATKRYFKQAELRRILICKSSISQVLSATTGSYLIMSPLSVLLLLVFKSRFVCIRQLNVYVLLEISNVSNCKSIHFPLSMFLYFNYVTPHHIIHLKIPSIFWCSWKNFQMIYLKIEVRSTSI